MDNYIGVKMIKAKRAEKWSWKDEDGNVIQTIIVTENDIDPKNSNTATIEEGYKVVYPDGYESWSPKDVFEKAYLNIGKEGKITEEVVTNFIGDISPILKVGKTGIGMVTLNNEFELVESSAPVDPDDYDPKIVSDIIITKVRDKIWEYLGFLLCTAKNGVKYDD